MWIKGYIQTGNDEAVFGKVHLVSDLRRWGGKIVGWMELSDNPDECVLVKRHPCGDLHGQVMREDALVGRMGGMV